MKKFLATAAGIFAATTMAASASAATLDFVAEAAGAERGVTNGITALNFQGSGYDVTFTAGGERSYHPYFDDLSGGKPAGLGVCKVLNPDVGASAFNDDGAVDDCVPGGDDNVTSGEWIELGFNKAFTLRDITFYDASHDELGVVGNDGEIQISFDGGAVIDMMFSDVISMANNGLFAAANTIRFIYDGKQFYVGAVSDVPIPGALPLLLSGIAGLGFASRRKKKAA